MCMNEGLMESKLKRLIRLIVLCKKVEFIVPLNPNALVKSLSGKLAFDITIWIAVLGYIMLLTSHIPAPVASGIKYSELGRFSGNQTTFDFQKTGDYYVNDTFGTAFPNIISRLEVYDDKNQLVFSLPLTNFPSRFEIDSKGGM